jgi:hypothetical protein
MNMPYLSINVPRMFQSLVRAVEVHRRMSVLSLVLLAAVTATCVSAATPPENPPIQTRMDPTTDPPQAELMPVEREYDRFQDKTTIKVEGIRPTVTKGDSRIFLNATSSSDGAAPTGKPEKVAINLLAVSEDFQYVDQREGLQFILLIGDKRIRVPAKFVKAGMTKDRNPKALESFVSIIDGSVLVSMATADSVEGQLGGSEFKLGAVEQGSLRRFAETVNLLSPTTRPTTVEVPPPGAPNMPVRVDAAAVHLAQVKVDEAQEKVDRLTAACMQRLEQTPQYAAALKTTQELEARKDKMSPGVERADVSQQWLEAKAKLSLIRSSALLEDNELAAARRVLGDAQTLQKAVLHPMDRAPTTAPR